MKPSFLALEIDQFAAQAIAAYNPSYRDRPFVVVRQHADSHKSTVRACCGKARALGVRPGMPVQTLASRFAGLAVLFPDPDLERTACEDLSDICSTYTPEYELDGRGTCLLDLSGTPALRRMAVGRVARTLTKEIRNRIGLEEVSAGASRRRLLARLMASSARPDGIRVCDPDDEEQALNALDPRLLPDLSGPCRDRLKKYGLRTVGQVRRLGREALVLRFGREGERLYTMSCGREAGERILRPKLLEAATVLPHDINDRDLLIERVRETLDRLCHELKSSDVRARRLTFVLRYTDNRAVRKTAGLVPPTNAFAALSPVAVRLYGDLDRRRVAVRSIELSASGLHGESGQMDLFQTEVENRRRSLERAVAQVRGRMGFDSILRASYLKNRDP